MKAQNVDKHEFVVTLITNDRREGAAQRLEARLAREVELQFGENGTVRPMKVTIPVKRSK